MTELCNHHAFLDYNAHKPGVITSARPVGKRVAVAPAVVEAGNRAKAPAAREDDSCGNSNGGNGNSSHAEAANASGVICSACKCRDHVRAKCPTRVCEQCGCKGQSKSVCPSTDEGIMLAQVVDEPFGSFGDEFANGVCEIAGGGVTDALMARDYTGESELPMLVGNDLGFGEETWVLDNGASKLMTPNSDFMFQLPSAFW